MCVCVCMSNQQLSEEWVGMQRASPSSASQEDLSVATLPRSPWQRGAERDKIELV